MAYHSHADFIFAYSESKLTFHVVVIVLVVVLVRRKVEKDGNAKKRSLILMLEYSNFAYI